MAARVQVTNATAQPVVETKQPMVIFQKTKMCMFYQNGKCTRGTACSFAHNPAEIRPMPDFSRTRLCERLIATGTCDDPACAYAHNREQLRRRKPMRVEIIALKGGNDAKSAKKQKSLRTKNTNGSGRQVAKDAPATCQSAFESDEEAVWLAPTTFSRQSTYDVDSNHCARARDRSVGSSTSSWIGFYFATKQTTSCKQDEAAVPAYSLSSMYSACESKTLSRGSTHDLALARLSTPEVEVAIKNSFLHFGPPLLAQSGRRHSVPARR